MKVNAIEIATWSQKLSKALQKFGRAVCLIPVRFRFVTPDAADPALIIAHAKICRFGINQIHEYKAFG